MIILLAISLRPLEAPAAELDDVRFTAWGKTELSWLDAHPHFLTREQLLALPVAPPPRNSDPATRADLDELLRLQAARTPAEQRAIEAHREYPGLCGAFFAALGRSPSTVPRTMALLKHADADVTVAVFNAKRRFNRARPHQLEPRLHPAIHVPAHPAYPSGHALQGYVVGAIMSLLVPAEHDKLAALGVQVGHEREIAGLHYAGDSAASRALGEKLVVLLQANPQFQHELESARREWLPR